MACKLDGTINPARNKSLRDQETFRDRENRGRARVTVCPTESTMTSHVGDGNPPPMARGFPSSAYWASLDDLYIPSLKGFAQIYLCSSLSLSLSSIWRSTRLGRTRRSPLVADQSTRLVFWVTLSLPFFFLLPKHSFMIFSITSTSTTTITTSFCLEASSRTRAFRLNKTVWFEREIFILVAPLDSSWSIRLLKEGKKKKKSDPILLKTRDYHHHNDDDCCIHGCIYFAARWAPTKRSARPTDATRMKREGADLSSREMCNRRNVK